MTSLPYWVLRTGHSGTRLLGFEMPGADEFSRLLSSPAKPSYDHRTLKTGRMFDASLARNRANPLYWLCVDTAYQAALGRSNVFSETSFPENFSARTNIKNYSSLSASDSFKAC